MTTQAPELAGHVAAVSYDTDFGRLTVCPESSTWATMTRPERTRVIEAANQAAGRTVVNSLRILPPGAAPVPAPADLAPADLSPAAPTGPVKTRETASEGYRRALAAHQEAASRRVDPSIAEAVERQTTAMRALSLRAFPEPEAAADDRPVPIEQARTGHRRQADISHVAALRRARAGRTTMPKRRTDTAVRRGGREPLEQGEAITMMTERGLAAPAPGGSVLAHRPFTG
ncbi:DciA family protein [Streptomyces fradiae]|uniref:DciA family protein n=1 Tax=Streptomyces fradiae TaxID=1906 RepID=UPI0038015A61